MASLFGREAEIERAERALANAKAGHGSLLLVRGEAGIGKSSIARELAARAEASGVRVLWGRCWEAGGAMPYWPWVQVFRGLGRNPFEHVTREQGAGADSQQQRFRLFDEATRELTASAAEQPLAILLDDLHAADLPSLFLLLFLARQLPAAPIFVLGAARAVEARMSPELVELLAKIGREGEEIALPRLTRDAVAAWVVARTGPNARGNDVFERTEGNPLFIEEVLRVGKLSAHEPVSDGIRSVIDEHLRKLSADERELLGAASVFGREFGSYELAAVVSSNHDAVLECTRRACELGVIDAVDPVRFQFTHILLRDRLHETLPARTRSELHWKAGIHAEAHGFDAALVAHHLLEGAGAGDADKAAASALTAAEQALGRLAFEAVILLAERGLALLGAARSPLVCSLEIVCGEALMRSGSIERGRTHCVRAADLAAELGCAEEQGRAALVYGSEVVGAPIVDPVMVRLLEAGLAAAGSGDSALAAKLSARLAAALIPPPNDEALQRMQVMASAAQAMARRIGDPETLLYVGEYCRQGVGYVMPSEERFALTRQTVRLAQQLDQRLTLIKVGPSYAVSLLERGFRVEADEALANVIELSAALDYPQSRWRLPMLQAGFALFTSQFDDAERLADQALALAEATGVPSALIEWASQRVALAVASAEPARIAPYAPRLLSIFERSPWMRPHRAWVLGAIGRRDEAIACLRAGVAMHVGFPTLLITADACALLEDRESATRIAERIEQWSYGNNFFWGSVAGYVHGPTARSLGDLARLRGRPAEARGHYEAAIELCRRVGAKPLLALSLAALERLNAEEGVTPVIAVPSGRTEARPFSLRREGDVWAVEGAPGAAFRLKHSKGLAYLNELLAQPGKELHVLSLIGIEHRAGDAGPVLDARAKAEYQTRLESLEDQISEAEGFGDHERANRAREEVDALASQLAGAVGLGGRDRRAASRRRASPHQRAAAAQRRHRERRPVRRRARALARSRREDGHVLLVYAHLARFWLAVPRPPPGR